MSRGRESEEDYENSKLVTTDQGLVIYVTSTLGT